MVVLMLCHTWPLVIKISGRKTGCGALCLNCPFYMADLTGVFTLCPALGTAGAVIPETGVAVARPEDGPSAGSLEPLQAGRGRGSAKLKPR